jgi:hypothetical protein
MMCLHVTYLKSAFSYFEPIRLNLTLTVHQAQFPFSAIKCKDQPAYSFR